MARLSMELPDNYFFSMLMTVRVTDLNYANHLGNDAMVSLLHEARINFLNHYHFTESDINGIGMMVTDLAVIYRSEAFGNDLLKFDVGVTDYNKYGCDIIYRVTQEKTGKDVAFAKTGVVFFDFKVRELKHVPEHFRDTFPAVEASSSYEGH